MNTSLALALLIMVLPLAVTERAPALNPPAFRVDHVADGDTITLGNGSRVRLVQIDTPEVYFRPECYGRRASAITKRLLRPGTLVRLLSEPATDRTDRYGRLLRYVIRIHDGLDVNIRLVAVGPRLRTSTATGVAATRRGSSAWPNVRGPASSACGATVRERRTTRTTAYRPVVPVRELLPEDL